MFVIGRVFVVVFCVLVVFFLVWCVGLFRILSLFGGLVVVVFICVLDFLFLCFVGCDVSFFRFFVVRFCGYLFSGFGLSFWLCVVLCVFLVCFLWGSFFFF